MHSREAPGLTGGSEARARPDDPAFWRLYRGGRLRDRRHDDADVVEPLETLGRPRNARASSQRGDQIGHAQRDLEDPSSEHRTDALHPGDASPGR
jgi:hypothetical protein